MATSLRPDITTSQNLALGALSYTTSIGRRWEPKKLLIHFSVAVTETITITLDSKNGASYDVPIHKRTLDSEQDYVYDFEDLKLYAGDEIKVQCTNANLTGVAYVTLKATEVLI